MCVPELVVQFYQDAPGRAVLRIAPAAGFSEDDERRVIRNLGRKMGDRLRIETVLVDSIPLSESGKAIYVDQKLRIDQ